MQHTERHLWWILLGLCVSCLGAGLLLVVPIVVPASLLVIIIATKRLSILEWRRLPGVCSHCEYDLTGKTTGICPECGAPVESVDADE